MNRPLATLIALSLTFAFTALPLVATERPGDDGSNLEVTITVTDANGGQSARSVRALLLEDQRTRLTSGWRIPTTTALSSDPSRPTAVDYQSVGLGTTLRGRRVGAERIRVDGEIELSSVDAAATAAGVGPGTPVVSTFRQVFDVILTPASPTVLGELPHPDGGSVVLSIRADVSD